MLFQKVAIIGVGEIGGSIGKILRKKRLARLVVGVGRRRSSLNKALKVGAVNRTFLVDRMRDAVSDADLIILATPVGKIISLGKRAASFAKKNAIITDVGSTKEVIVKELQKSLPKDINFVGSHPMAGSEKGGPLSAKVDLFKGRDCFITKTQKTNKKSIKEVKRFWKALGSNPIEISLSEHDRVVGMISQAVHIVASSLVIANKSALKYAASGFRDTTRIALSDSGMWKDICITNNKEIAISIDKLIKVLRQFKTALSGKKATQIERMLKKAKKLRQGL